MTLNRLLTTTAALIAFPIVALAQPASTPAPDTSAAPPAAAPAAPATPALPTIPKVAGGPDIYTTLKDSGQFGLLVKALDQSGLTAPLKGNANLTMFAPTDAALNSLPPDVLTKLMAPNDTSANQLQQILKYHIVFAQVDSSKIKGAKGPLKTIENNSVTLDGSNPDDLLVNNADIIQADIRTTNGGIIHVIDKVLIPSDSPYASLAAPPAPAGGTPAPTGTQ